MAAFFITSGVNNEQKRFALYELCSNVWCCCVDCCHLSDADYYMVVNMKINHTLLRLAQIKARIARKNGDGAKWMEANEEMKAAAGMPWYRRQSIQH